jgi:Ca2+-binding EF-hand superfamily protein
VEAYGKESPGFLQYPEFKEVYMTHAHPIGAPTPEEGKLLALFNLFDVQSRGKIAKADFVATLQRTKPAVPLVDRLASKVRKGGERLVRALTEEFQEADAPFGCHGELPLKNFQVILADYDLPVLEADL